MPKFKKCPRCELNYILEEEDNCDVCKAELKIGGFVLLEDDSETLCPVCLINYLDAGEKVCSECKEKTSKKKTTKFNEEIVVDADDSDEVSLSEVEEEEENWIDPYDESFDDVDSFGADDFIEDEFEEVEEDIEEEDIEEVEEDDFEEVDDIEDDFDDIDDEDDEDLEDEDY